MLFTVRSVEMYLRAQRVMALPQHRHPKFRLPPRDGVLLRPGDEPDPRQRSRLISFSRASRRRRTFAIISHPDAGKTTLTEHLLLLGGAIHAAGRVKARGEARRAKSDWMKIEQERGISVTSAVMTFEYKDAVFNLLDTPGHEDFSEDTYRTLTAADSAVMVIDAAKGIETQTRKLFEVCRLRDIPIMTFVNKMDREARDPFELLDEISDQLQLETAPMMWPAGMGLNFKGVLDLSHATTSSPFGSNERGPCQPSDAAEDLKAKLDEDVQPGARRPAALRSRHLSRRPSDAGLFRLGAEEFRRRRAAGCAGADTRPVRRARRPRSAAPSSRATRKSPASSSRSRPTWTPTIATVWRSCGWPRASSGAA